MRGQLAITERNREIMPDMVDVKMSPLSVVHQRRMLIRNCACTKALPVTNRATVWRTHLSKEKVVFLFCLCFVF